MARRDRARRRATTRGVSCGEVVGYLTLLCIVSGGAVFLAHARRPEPRLRSATIDLQTIRRAAEIHMNMISPGGCPTLADLDASRMLSPRKVNDPWGSPYRLQCAGEDVVVWSNGRDGEAWTDDDLSTSMAEGEIQRRHALGRERVVSGRLLRVGALALGVVAMPVGLGSVGLALNLLREAV